MKIPGQMLVQNIYMEANVSHNLILFISLDEQSHCLFLFETLAIRFAFAMHFHVMSAQRLQSCTDTLNSIMARFDIHFRDGIQYSINVNVYVDGIGDNAKKCDISDTFKEFYNRRRFRREIEKITTKC